MESCARAWYRPIPIIGLARRRRASSILLSTCHGSLCSTATTKQTLRGAAGQDHITSLAATTTARSVRHTATREPPRPATVPHPRARHPESSRSSLDFPVLNVCESQKRTLILLLVTDDSLGFSWRRSEYSGAGHGRIMVPDTVSMCYTL